MNRLSLVFCYGLAVASVTTALLVVEPLRGVVDTRPFFYAAVVLSAWLGGVGPGLLSVLLSTLAIDYFLIPPLHVLTWKLEHLPRLAAFALSAVVVSWLSVKRHRLEESLRQARDDLEAKVQERTAHLARQARLLDLAEDAIAVRDLDGRIEFWNRGAVAMYGWSKPEALGQISHDLLKTVFPKPAKDVLADVLRDGSWQGELAQTRRDGGSITVASRWALQRSETGEAQAILEINTDVTEKKRAEETLAETRAELAHATRVATLGEMASSIAHEVNQPLAAAVVNGNAGLRWLGARPPDLEEARGAFERIIRDANRASDILARIRGLLRKDGPRKVSLDVNELVLDTVALVEPEAGRHRAVLTTDLPPALPAVRGDRVQLQQVLLNLVLNGIEAMGRLDGRPRRLVVRTALESTGDVLVAVEDSGPGLDPQTLDRLFDPFFTTKAQGLGLGLSISRSIVEAHGGRLTAGPASRGGAMLRFTLPAQ